MISNTCKYAVRSVIYLAIYSKNNEKIGIKKISEELDLPGPFLGKIMQTLAKNKLLNSIKGPHGGFSLAKDPYQISLYDIVEIIDGTDVFNECLIGVRICIHNPEHEVFCPFYKRSHEVRRQLIKVFREQTIGDFADGINKSGVDLKI